MIVNFYRLYGRIFYTINKYKRDTVYFANTHDDLIEKSDKYIPSDNVLTDRQARNWFKEHYPNYEIHKIDKHYHTELRERDGDVRGD